MISALVILSQQPVLPALWEFPTEKAERTHFEIVVKLPRMEGRLRRAVSAAGHLAVYQFSSLPMRVGEGGPTLHYSETADFLRFSLTTTAQRQKAALRTLAELLTQPNLPIEVELTKEGGYRADRSSAANNGYLDNQQLNDAWRFAVNSATVSVGVSGQFAPGAMEADWKGFQFEWPLPPNFPPSIPASVVPLNEVKEISSFKLSMSPALTTRAELAKVLVAANVMAGGKECLAWRVFREEAPLAYQFGAKLKREGGWWVLELEAETKDAEGWDLAKASLAKHIAALSKEDLDVAIGNLKAQLITGVSPLGIEGIGSGNIVANAADRLYLRTIWKATTGMDWSEYNIYSDARQVSVNEIKALLEQWLKGD